MLKITRHTGITPNNKPLKNACYLTVALCLVLSCQSKQPTLFQLKTAEETGIDFKNEIIENDTHNILNFTNLYTGSGVGIGDFNKDGQPDIFFGGNMESSRLYINKGNFQFDDQTKAAGLTTNRWVTGVAIADVNADGWPDIYLSVSGNATAEQRKNLLFINESKGRDTVYFTEQAEVYGLADTTQCTHANFFDYDKDGDLDLFVIVNPTDYKLYNVNNIRRKKVNGEGASTDKLYRNNQLSSQNEKLLLKTIPLSYKGAGSSGLKFTNVSKEAGILLEGYSLSLNVSDLNNDNYPDIYITNDFLTNDILYINNQDGTFTNRAADMLRHTSFASMGVDVADINNDGLPEIYALDMFPEDNYRQKMIMGSGNYDRFQYLLKAGYEPQYSRNTLQLNNGDGSFSEIGQLANIHKTDWSWSALLADYDNDGLKDLYITNGFHRDLGDLDYINYNNNNAFGSPESRKQQQLHSILQQPSARLSNYIYKNETGISFSKKSTEWGIDQASCSHGAAFADLDGDGDLDLVVNNVSQTAFIYENKATELISNHYIKIQLISENPTNRTAVGAKIWLHYNDTLQYLENTPYRGYQSTVTETIHFGLGKTKVIDSLKIQWPNNKTQSIYTIPVDTLLKIKQNSPQNPKAVNVPLPFKGGARGGLSIFQKNNLLSHQHQEDRQVDFKAQVLLPHQHSKAGPHLSVGDINGDDLEDVFIGGAAGFSGTWYLQNQNATFTPKSFDLDTEREDTHSLLFDADGDKDLDLYITSGGVVANNNPNIYQDRLYLNDGKGNFKKAENALPNMPTSTACVVGADYDQDGDIDLFIGGRVSPKQYPITPNSYLLENNQGIFKDITPKELSKIGMVTSALWTDYDTDGDQDLLLAGEFMPLTIFKNTKGKITLNASLLIPKSNGWWNTLAQADFDQDGDMDYLAGNLGLNTNYRATPEKPLCLYANDYDKNGSLDPVLCQYIDGIEYPIPSRDQLISQIPPIKVRFNSYKKYANTPYSEVFKGRELHNRQILESHEFRSCYIENKGTGLFVLHPLPLELQFAPIHDFLIKDFTDDGHLDALAIGNNYATEVGIGRYDASTGALLIGSGQGTFTVARGATTGLVANKDARTIATVQLANQQELILIGNNSDSLQCFIK